MYMLANKGDAMAICLYNAVFGVAIQMNACSDMLRSREVVGDPYKRARARTHVPSSREEDRNHPVF